MDSLKILIVDDEEITSDFIKIKIAAIAPHFQIAQVDNGHDCIEYLKEHGADCILSDYQMRGMDGMELLKELRAGGRKTPFIFITGQGNEEVASEAFKNGASDYFTKDIGFAHFPRIINSIERAVRGRREQEHREKAEAALVSEKAKLESILASMGDGISIQDRDYRVIYQNPAHKEIIGEHTGELCYEAYEGRDGTCEGCPVAEAFRDGRSHTTERLREKEGRTIRVEITASPLKDESGNIVAGIEMVRDVGFREEYERRLRESEENYRLLFEDNPNPMLVYDVNTLEILAVNNAAVSLYCYTREEFLRISAVDIRPPEDAEKFLNFIKQRRGEEFRQSTWRHKKKDGTVIDVQILSHSISFEGRNARSVMISDVTEQKKAQAALKESEARFRSLVESSLVGIFIIKDITNDRRLVYSNPHFRRMLGYTQEELEKLDIAKLVHPQDLPKVRESHKKKFSGETEDVRLQSRLVRKDGGIIDVEVLGTVIEYEGAQAVFGEALDITERKRAEGERSSMLNMLTHDIRSPLSVIYGYGGLASQQLTCDEAAEAISDIQKAAKKIRIIIDNMLSLSRLEEAELIIQQAHLPEIINQAVRENEAAAAEKRVEIEASAEANLPKIYCDSAQIGRAIGNLISNAVSYNRRGGKVSVRSGPARDGREVYIEVSDTGDGIDEEDLPKIFDKYYRGKTGGNNNKGTGLGLAIVKAVAESHGGRVEVKCTKGKGSSFRLILPVKPGL